MLPSFRLIAATFFCGFLIVFAGLRLAASLNDMHEGLPVMAAHAAAIPAAPAADRDARRAASSVPVMYDLRFAVAPVSPTLVRSAPTIIDYPKPTLPLTIVPPEIVAKDSDTAPSTDVASIDREADVTPAQTTAEPVATEPEVPETTEPLPPPAASEGPAPEAKTAAVDPQATPAAEAAPPVAEPQTTQSVDVPIPAQDAAKDKPDTASAKPAPEAEHIKKSVKAAAARPKPARKARVRTARRATSNDSFDTNNPSTQPFGGSTHTR